MRMLGMHTPSIGRRAGSLTDDDQAGHRHDPSPSTGVRYCLRASLEGWGTTIRLPGPEMIEPELSSPFEVAAGGRVVMDVLKNSAADGSVMVLTPAVAVALYPHVYKSLSYDPQQDFAPVTTISTTSMLFVVGPLVPSSVKTLADFIAWCRSNPNQSSYGTPGAGSPLHFLGVMLSRAADFEYLHVPFQGTAPSIQSLLGSQIASCISPIGPFVPHVRAGTLRALATTGAQRSPLLPDVPTIDEAGYPALEFAEWFGILVPARTPSGTIEALSSALRAALQTKEVQAGLANQSVDVGGLTPADFARQVKADFGRWGPIVKASGFTPLD